MKIPLRKGSLPTLFLGFPGGSDDKESACNAGDLGWENPMEESMATHSSILAWRIPMDRGAWRAAVHGCRKELETMEYPSMHTQPKTQILSLAMSSLISHQR